ncbi:MAG: ATP-binding protein [Fimbriimonas sp.]
MESVVPWRVRTFGGFSVERNGVRFDRFRTQHAAGLLAFLALRPDVRHSREVLAEHLWPAADPLVGRQRLSTALANLRRELEANGPPVFTGGRESVGIHPGMLTSDAAEFGRLVRQARGARRDRRRDLLREALELGEGGEFLPGLYFEWAIERSTHFGEALDAIRAELQDGEGDPTPPAEDASSLVGRLAEIESLDRMLAEGGRCLSILGAGGVGKTRLALDLFERHARRYPGATAFVRLAEVRQPADFLAAVAQALRLTGGESAIAGALALRSLVVLDNLEHLLPQIHPPLDRLIRSCGNCTFVCTSRRRLDVAGERILRIRPLGSTSGSWAEAPAVRLFVARHREAGGPPLGPESLPAVAEICRALGGLPLAIQLAASASVALGFEALRADPRLHRLLPSRNPDATNPHASLAEMIDWSLKLLDGDVRGTLDALCILPGSFGFPLVRDLYGDAAACLPKLHGDSLLEADGNGALRVLEPIRDHVRAQMDQAHRTRLEIQLVERCADLAEGFEPRLEGPDQRSATADAAAFWSTMRLAAQLAAEHRRPNEGLTILTGFARLFHIDMSPGNAVALTEPLLALEGIDPRIHARALAATSCHLFTLGRAKAAQELALAAIALAKQVGDPRAEARGTFCQAYVALVRERQAETLTLADRALALARQADDRGTQAWALLVRAHAHALYRKEASEEEVRRSRAEIEAALQAAGGVAREAKDDLMEATIGYHGSIYAGTDFDLYRARLLRAIEINRRNGWPLREAQARSALIFRLYTADYGGDVLDEVRSLQRLYADCGCWDIRAEQLAFEAEVLFRTNRLPEAQSAIENALSALGQSDRYYVVEYHVQALIYGALGHPEADAPLLALVERGSRNEFSAMLADLARALLEARRGEDAAAFRRLRHFGPESKPTRVRHAFADTLVAFADLVAPRNLPLAIDAYRRARRVYREVRSTLDLHRVRQRVSQTAQSRATGRSPV